MHARLLEDRDGVVQHRVDARRLVAGEDDDGQDERDHILLLEERVRRGGVLRLLGGGGLVGGDHVVQNLTRLLLAIVRGERGKGFVLAPFLVEPARRLLQLERTQEEDEAGDAREEEDHLPGVDPLGDLRGGEPVLDLRERDGGRLDALLASHRENLLVRVAHEVGDDETDERDEDEADGQEELEHPRALATRVRVKALGEIHRHDDAEEAGRRALHGATDDHHPKVAALEEAGRADDGNGNEEEERGGDDHFLAPEPLGEEARDERGRERAPKRHADDPADLVLREGGRPFDVGERGGDHADIDTVEQASESGHDEQKLRVSFDRHCVPLVCFRLVFSYYPKKHA